MCRIYVSVERCCPVRQSSCTVRGLARKRTNGRVTSVSRLLVCLSSPRHVLVLFHQYYHSRCTLGKSDSRHFLCVSRDFPWLPCDNIELTHDGLGGGLDTYKKLTIGWGTFDPRLIVCLLCPKTCVNSFTVAITIIRNYCYSQNQRSRLDTSI